MDITDTDQIFEELHEILSELYDNLPADIRERKAVRASELVDEILDHIEKLREIGR